MAEKMGLTEAVNEIIKFKNVFRAAEHIEEVLTSVTNLKGEVARLNKEKKEAEEATMAAYEARDKAKALLEQTEQRLKQAQDGFDGEVQARREQADKDILAVKNEARAEMDRIKADHKAEVDRFFDGLKERAVKL